MNDHKNTVIAIVLSALVLIACGLLSGCLTPALRSVFREPVYNFVTTDEVGLREDPEDESHIIAILPKGTPVAPVGVNSECNCWEVEALGHTGWLYQRYIRGPILASYINEP